MTNWVLDLGNSYSKLAEVVDNQLGKVERYKGEDFLARLQAKDKLSFASVRDNQTVANISDYCQANQIECQQVKTEYQAFGVTHGYQDYHTHGVDRWLAVLAARQLTNKAFAVIDLGTAATLDVVDQSGQHLGGWIALGFELAKTSVLANTDKVFTGDVKPQLFATDTASSLEAGCQRQLTGFVQQAIQCVQQHLTSDAEIFFTGGGISHLPDELLTSGNIDKNLVLQGLILYNQAQ